MPTIQGGVSDSNLGGDTVSSHFLSDALDTLGLDEANATGAGGSGNDVVISAPTDPSSVDGGLGDDIVIGGAANDTVLGGDGNDYTFGGDGNDFSEGGRGNDQVFGGGGDDFVGGGYGDDSLDGGSGNDIVGSTVGADTIAGQAGDDMLLGGSGDDSISGGEGDDSVYGGYGNDTAEGGAGSDRFYFTTDGLGQDVIEGFFNDSGDNADRLVIAQNINGLDLTAASDLESRVSADADGNAVIDLGDGNTVTLKDVSADALLENLDDWVELV